MTFFFLLQSGLLLALPYFLQLLITIGTGIITDYLTSNKWVSVAVARKGNASVSLLVPAVFVLLAGYAGCDTTATVVYFTISASVMAFRGKSPFKK